jgi:hypothetical protein
MKPIHLKYLLGAALIVMMGFAVAGHPIVAPEVLGSLSLIGFVGDISLVEIKSLIDQQGEAWEAYKKTHDDLLKAKAEGKAVAELEAKLAKIGADIDRVSEVKAKLEALEQVLVKMQRAGLGGAGGDVDIATETKAFNAIRRSYAEGKQIADVSDEDYAQYKSAFFSYVRKGKLERSRMSSARRCSPATTRTAATSCRPRPSGAW